MFHFFISLYFSTFQVIIISPQHYYERRSILWLIY
nr:MAG TPA: hypothetical protein [Caudoviricetes sp.]